MANLCFSQGLLQQNLGGSPKTQTRSGDTATPAAGTPAADPPAGEPRPDSEGPAGIVKIGSKKNQQNISFCFFKIPPPPGEKIVFKCQTQFWVGHQK